MDKKRPAKNQIPEDLKGFEEFIDGQGDSNFLPRGNGTKKEVSFEHFTFLTNDTVRLSKIKNLLMDKIPFAAHYDQGDHLMQNQLTETKLLKKQLFELMNRPDSAYRKTMQGIFDSFFEPPKL